MHPDSLDHPWRTPRPVPGNDAVTPVTRRNTWVRIWEQAGLLASGSSYRPRLPTPKGSGHQRLSSPVTAAGPRRICTVFPIKPSSAPIPIFWTIESVHLFVKIIRTCLHPGPPLAKRPRSRGSLWQGSLFKTICWPLTSLQGCNINLCLSMLEDRLDLP